MEKQIKVLLTGGHAGATSFAVIEEIEKKHSNWKIFFIGGKSSVEGSRVKPLFHINLQGSSVINYSLITGRIQRKFTFWTIPSLLKIPVGFIHALLLLIIIRPNVVMSFGGYAAVPVVFWAWIARIPIVVHEQTATAGRANMLSARFASKIVLSRQSSLSYFNTKKSVVLGNPMSCGVINIKPRLLKSSPPVLLIHGGASGSASINNLVSEILSTLVTKYKVIHQTGQIQFEQFVEFKKHLPERLKDNYEVHSIVKSQDWHNLLQKADILVSRSGANIVSEILHTKIPSLLIPLPIAYLDEQRQNALYAQEFGIARVLDQYSLTPPILLKEIDNLSTNWLSIVTNVRSKKSPDIHASKKMVTILEDYLQ
jgi:UDP-N-acetylglucosamine--N-acetylmuramyl-(pentapeptide) pyrophosphoryl-undecaprenol N-acetylglucosamine transferase